MNRHGRSLERFRAQDAPFGEFVHEEDGRISDSNVGVHELSFQSGDSAFFHGIERPLVKFDSLNRAGENQMGVTVCIPAGIGRTFDVVIVCTLSFNKWSELCFSCTVPEEPASL